MRVAVGSRTFSRHPQLRSELLALYPDTIFNDQGLSLKGDELVEFLSNRDAAIIALEPMTEKVFSALPELKVIGKFGVGFDKLDLAAMTRCGVRLGWTGGVNKRSVTELAVTMMISLLRNVDISGREIREGQWKLRPGRELSFQTVGIIGCGHIGKDLAIILRALGCKVLVNDIIDFADFYKEHGLIPVSLDELLEQADVVTLHVPLNQDTRYMICAESLARMKETAILINTARGGLVDEVALKERLKSGKLFAAAFDVFEIEPPQDMELLNLHNFMVTTHMGGSAAEAILAMGRAAIKGIAENRLPEIGVFPL